MVGRGGFEREDPWTAPASRRRYVLRRAVDGAPPRLATSVAAWFDEQHLTLLFSAPDDHLDANLLRHDAPLYEQDVVEVFFAPEELTRYFELEVSPRGTIFDARVLSPDGDRATMHVDRAWDCEGLMAAVRVVTEPDGAMTVDTILRSLLPPSAVPRPRWASGGARTSSAVDRLRRTGTSSAPGSRR